LQNEAPYHGYAGAFPRLRDGEEGDACRIHETAGGKQSSSGNYKQKHNTEVEAIYTKTSTQPQQQ